MKRKLVCCVVVASAAAAAGWLLSSRARLSPATSDVRPVAPSSALGERGVAAGMLEPALASTLGEGLEVAPAVDLERVRVAIDALNEVGASITRAELDEEQRALLARIHEMSTLPVQEPEAHVIPGSNRTPWVELRYPSGEVRYEISDQPQLHADHAGIDEAH